MLLFVVVEKGPAWLDLCAVESTDLGSIDCSEGNVNKQHLYMYVMYIGCY